MAALTPCLAQLSRMCISSGPRTITHRVPTIVLAPPLHQVRYKSAKADKGSKVSKSQVALKTKKLVERKKKRKPSTTFRQFDLKAGDQFALCDAVRYIRAFEVGRQPTSIKYEIALKLKTLKNGPAIRNRLRLPHPVKTDVRICVIAPPDSKYAESAKAAGAVLVGEDEIFEAVKAGRIDFDRCICQLDSYAKMTKAGLGRLLGPKGLMPSPKLGTVVKDPSMLVRDFIGGAEYRERVGVIRMAVGQLGFTPEQLSKNIKTFMESVDKDMTKLSEKIRKEVAEVVLSSTNGPGFSLNGDFRDPKSDTQPKDLSNS